MTQLRKLLTCTCFTLSLIVSGILVSTVASAQDAKRSITKIAGDLYRFENNFHRSVFLVTSEGIILIDPINSDAAQWLKKELKTRFGKSVRYLVYSHDHADHISGGEVFTDTATVISHEIAKQDIIDEKRATAIPHVTFKDKLTIELGGKKVELSYLGRSHSDNLIIVRFPAERLVYAVDIIKIKGMAYKTIGDAFLPDWIDALKRIEALDYDILDTGHGKLGTPADATDFRVYMESLQAEVFAAHRAGKSLTEMQESITMDDYKGWRNYDKWLKLNIEGMYNQVKLHRRGN